MARSSDMASEDDHPVEIPYGQKLSSHAENFGLKPTSRLDRRVRLFGSHMGCGSCHSTYSRNSRLLVIPNTGSRLCLTCHQV